MSEKVYCENCKWFEELIGYTSDILRYSCKNKKFVEHTSDWHSPCQMIISQPSELNKKNNCKGFEPK